MLAKDVVAEEARYHKSWIKSEEVKPAKQGKLAIFDYKPKNRKDYFFKEECPKDLIVLHHTAGWLWGDLETLTKTNSSHVNFRATGKTDIGPAFEWNKIGG